MEENDCSFISSRGIAKICNQKPTYFINNKKDYDFSTDVNYGDIIYVDFKILRFYIYQILHNLKNSIVLVCGDDDNDFPEDFLDLFDIIEYNDKILSFWCQNTSIETKKIKNIPIGLDYHSMRYDTNYLVHGQKNISPFIQEQQIINIKNNFKKLEYCKSLCIANFHLAMDMEKREKVRLNAYNILKNNSCVKFLERQSRIDYMNELNNYAFAICPSGNGRDTHRLWETLILNRIPIVNNNGLKVYEDLPIIIIDDWNIITEKWLENKHKEIINNIDSGIYNLEKLYLKYWKNLFNMFKNIKKL